MFQQTPSKYYKTPIKKLSIKQTNIPNSIKMASDIDAKYPGVKPKFNNLIDEAKQIKQEVQGESGRCSV